MRAFPSILLAKGVRVFVFGLASILTPIYILVLGYPAFYVGLALAAIVGGNIFSNTLVTWFGWRIGVRRLLLAFSALMFVSGVVFSATRSFPLILLACFLGNVSTTGTEAGPFQSIETGVLPAFTPNRTGRAFGLYNLAGYSASSFGALAASLPSYFSDRLAWFHYLYLLYGGVGLILFSIYWGLRGLDSAYPKGRLAPLGVGVLGGDKRREVARLSALFGLDAFGGGFVSQSLLATYFYLAYKISLRGLGEVFLAANIITATSIVLAPLIAERIGNLRTMVSTHLVSNAFLVAIPFAGSAAPAIALLFLRQCFSQMDVPTRQAFMVEIFEGGERVAANAITNTSRSIAGFFGPPISGALFSAGLASAPLIVGGAAKIAYDLTIFFTYRKKAR